MTHAYEYARPALTVDIVVFALDQEELQVMLIQREPEPFSGRWALPGGFVGVDESLEEVARREMQAETGLTDIFLEQLYTFGDIGRDPRGRVVTVAYFALVNVRGHNVHASTDAHNAAWFAVNDLPELAFDHERIVTAARERLRAKVRYQPIGFELLPKNFTLRQLQHLYEVILDRELDKRNFRKKVLSMGLIVRLNETEKDVAHRAGACFVSTSESTIDSPGRDSTLSSESTARK